MSASRRLLVLVAAPLLLLSGSILSGCDATSTAPTAEVVVEAYLEAGAPLGPVRLTRSVGVDAVYTPDRGAVAGAVVTVERLDAAGAVDARYAYAPSAAEAGLYRAVDDAAVARPRATYRLVADVPDAGRLMATTTVPDTFSVVRLDNPTAVFQGPAQPSLTVTRSGGAGRQDVFVFTVTSLLDAAGDDLVGELTPFYADVYDPDEEPIDDLRVNPSPVLNEANYDQNPDGTLTIDLPWIAVVFYGPNRTAINVLDDNYYDFLRTQQAQQGARPGEIPNVIDRVDGGTGLFGSYARAAVDVRILRPPAGAR
jgi:hypothetical protein